MKYTQVALQVLSVIILLCTTQPTMAQKNISDIEKRWTKVTEHMDNQLPKSALEVYNNEIKPFVKADQKALYLKGQIFEYLTFSQQDINPQSQYTHLLERIQEQPDQVSKAIWHGITADMLNNYQSNNRWKIQQITLVKEDIGNDIAQWSNALFQERITFHYLQSVAPSELLQAIPLKDYSMALTASKNIEEVWPSLYDMLASTANEYLKNKDRKINFDDGFAINDEKLFVETFAFVQLNLRNFAQDAEHPALKSLHLYQLQLQEHLEKGNLEALVFTDMKRLETLHELSNHEYKSEWYYKALKKIVDNYPSVKETQLAKVKMLEMLYYSRPRAVRGNEVSISDSMSVKNIVSQLSQILQQHPQTLAANEAHTLLAIIESKTLSIATETVLLPKEHNLISIEYRNVTTAHLKLIKIPSSTYLQRYNSNDFLKEIKKYPVLKSWTVTLPKGDDYEHHLTEVVLEPLDYGQYILLVGEEENINEAIAFTKFQVSNLSYTELKTDDKNAFIALHRKNGTLIPNIKVQLYENSYNRNNKQYEYTLKDVGIGNAKGYVDFNIFKKIGNESYYRYITFIIQGNDTLISNTNGYNNGPISSYTDITSHIFTDRAIYRPGQQVHFKGIVYSTTNNPAEKYVIPNSNVEVTIYDANQQEIIRLELKTNEFGSYQGVFTLPTGLLNGNFSIYDGESRANFKVEAYKLPKYFIELDTVQSSFSLNQQIKIPGKATAYAGYPVDNAKVTYKVTRGVNYPFYNYYWRWRPEPSMPKIIAEGTLITNADGAFEIPVTLLPDFSVDKRRFPTFNYNIQIDVTDINGETHTKNTTISAGYAPYLINIDNTPNPKLNDLAQLKISTTNYSGAMVQVPLTITLSKLESPGFYKKRYWDKPDVQTISKSEFQKLFPTLAYEEEDNPATWNTLQNIQTWNNHIIENGTLAIDISKLKDNGYYKLVVQDSKDTNVSQTYVFHIFESNLKGNAEQALIIQTNKNKMLPDEKLDVVINTINKVTPVQIIEKNHLKYQLHQSSKHIQRVVEEADRGGIVYSAFMVYDNRFYTLQRKVDVPWTNKELNIEWASHRDKLLPGEQETWKMTIRGDKKEKVAAEIMSVLYDASLDALAGHTYLGITDLYPEMYAHNLWNVNEQFRNSYSNHLKYLVANPRKHQYFHRQFPQWQMLSYMYGYNTIYASAMPRHKAAPAMNKATVSKDEAMAERSDAVLEQVVVVGDITRDISSQSKVAPPLRANFNETAYFFPQMKTNEQGEVEISFTIPESLTEWKMMTIAHTKDMRIGYLDGKVKTQKDIMVQPNMPRYFRQNDQVTLSAKLVNMTASSMQANANLQILDPETREILDLPFRLVEKNKSTTMQGNASTEVSWEIHIPASRYTPVLVRISAQAGNHTDGEEHLIPVLTNRTLVTETISMPMTGTQTKKFEFKSMLDNTSATISNKAFTLEFTSNPAWYAVQALPYLKDYPYECAEQIFSKIYANAIAQKIVEEQPSIVETFQQWETKDSSELQSKLLQNQNLKTTLIQETPWVLEAQDESAQKRQLATLFDENILDNAMTEMITKLVSYQNGDGGFPWFDDLPSNAFITQYIATGYGRLQAVDAMPKDMLLKQKMEAAVQYLDNWLVKEFEKLKKYNKNWQQLSSVDPYMVNYMYMRSFYKNISMDKSTKAAMDFYYSKAKQNAVKMPLFNKAQMAIVTKRNNDTKTAQLIVQSLQETAIVHEEMGMYWKDMPRGYYWYEAPIETQSLIIEAFQEVTHDTAAINLMKTWLIKQKQTQHWGTTKATTDATYALLLQGDNWLDASPVVNIKIGNEAIQLTEQNTTAGVGYFQQSWKGTSVKKDLAKITIDVQQPQSATGRPSWGAAYWQYFEDMDKVKNANASPLSVNKSLFLRKIVNNQEQLIPITPQTPIQVGDRVTVRVVMKTDRDMEYIHLKDMRAAAFEPVDVLSGYHYSNGLGYYRSISDASMNFFFDRINKGTYVFEYDVFANAKGTYSNGITTIQCMYAPEFSSHTEGIRVEVK